MSSRTLIVVLLALFCGASAAVGVSQLRARSGQSADSGNSKPVVTVVGDVGIGTVLDAKMLRVSNYQDSNVPKGAITTLDDAVERTVLVPLVAGEPVLAGKLADKGAGHGLAATIPDGMRAFTIVTPVSSADVGGFLMPGNHVDVLLTTSPAGRNDQTGGGVTTTLLQNVEVKAVGQKLDAPADSKLIANEVKTVTLLVTPDQAAKLDLGMNKGILHLALRGPADKKTAKTTPATMNDIEFHQEKATNWGEVALNVLAAASTLSAAAPAPATAEKPKEAPLPQVQQASYAEIRTLRGMDAGTVQIPLPH